MKDEAVNKKPASPTVLWMRVRNLEVLADIYRERGDEKAAEDCEALASKLLMSEVH